MKHRIGCAVKDCKKHSSWPLSWLHIPSYDVYICPACEKKYCVSDGKASIALKDIPLKDGVNLEEQS